MRKHIHNTTNICLLLFSIYSGFEKEWLAALGSVAFLVISLGVQSAKD